MKKDLTVNVDGDVLNVRVGCILSYKNSFLLEQGDEMKHKTIPGGRVKIMELSKEAVLREIKEELDFDMDDSRVTKYTVLENFFRAYNKDFHEIYFIYEYRLIDQEYDNLKQVKRNKDSNNSSYEFVKKEDIYNVNILPVALKKIIQNYV